MATVNFRLSLRRLVLMGVCAGFLGFTPTFTWGQAAAATQQVSPSDKLLAKRAAQLDAYRQLIERIMGLQISSATTVKDFVTEDDRIGTALETFIRGVRFSEPRYFDDGSCEVDAEVTLAQVITAIQKAYDDVYRGGKWQRSDFENITKTTQYTTIRVTGGGAVRADAVVPDPTTAPLVAPLVSQATQHIALPDIYRKYAPNERLKARRAAELDGYRQLMERMYGLQVSANSTVQNFVTTDDHIRTCLEGYLKGARIVEIRYDADGVVEVEMQVTIEQVITAIQKSYDEVYHGGQWQRSDFENVTKYTQRKTLTVVGTGALDTQGAGAARQGGDDGQIIESKTVIVDPGDAPKQ